MYAFISTTRYLDDAIVQSADYDFKTYSQYKRALKKMTNDIDKVWNMPGGKEKYWEQVVLDVCKKNYQIYIRECNDGDIIEIDTFNELKEIDKTYDV